MSKRARAVNRLFVDYIVLLKWSIRSILFPFDSIPSATQNRLLYATAAMLVRCLRSLERDTRSNEHAQCTNLYIYTVDIWYGMVYMCVLCCIYVYISTCNFGKENHDIMARIFFIFRCAYVVVADARSFPVRFQLYAFLCFSTFALVSLTILTIVGTETSVDNVMKRRYKCICIANSWMKFVLFSIE